jgi:hypothetical protein
VLIALGAALAAFVMVDAVRTTINLTQRPGPIARTVVAVGRRLVRLLPGGARATAGLFMTIAVVISWTLGLWASWTIALLDPAVELIRTADREPLGPIDTLYLAGFSVFTLGTGDIAPATTVGRLVTVVAAATGLFTVTLEVTYLLSLTSAASHERSTARHTYALGSDVGIIVRRAYRDGSFRQLEPLLAKLAADLSDLAEHHRTFPVLHDVLPRERSLALGPSLLALSDAMDLLRYAVPPEAGLGALAYEQVAEAMDGLIERLPYLDRPDPPPRPDPRLVLALVGVDPVGEVVMDEVTDERRRGLFALAVEEGWRDEAMAAVSVVTQADR